MFSQSVVFSAECFVIKGAKHGHSIAFFNWILYKWIHSSMMNMRRLFLVLEILIIGIHVIMMKAEGFNVGITYIQSAVAKGAVCLDGSPPAYHFDKGFGTGINNWLIHIEGGGWCNNVTTCLTRKNTRLGSSKQMATQIAFSGILSKNLSFNPGCYELFVLNCKLFPFSCVISYINRKLHIDFYNWNRIKVRYCDGASFTGDVEAVNRVTNLHFRGARVFVVVIEDLLAKGMKNAQNAILSGCSAGGLTSLLHCDKFRALMPLSTKVKCISDAGYFINVKDISSVPHIQNFYKDVVKTHGSTKNLPVSCTSKMIPSLVPQCFFPQNFVKEIKTPFFLLNAAYDSWQIKNILAPSVADPHGIWRNCTIDITKCSAPLLHTMEVFRLHFLSTLSGVSNPTRGLFINSCYAHCQTERQETWLRNDSPQLDGMSIAKAIGDWYHGRSYIKKNDCAYPCDTTCHNRVFYPNENTLGLED